MKKILSIVLIVIFSLSLVACDLFKKDNSIEKLNELSQKTYNKVELNVTIEKNGHTLTSKYVLSAGKIEYTVEQMSLLSPDNIPNDIKTVYRGTATVENGVITKVDGDAITLPEYETLSGSFSFSESYFKSVLSYTGHFVASVADPSAFIGTDADVKNMKVEVKYTDTALTTISIGYGVSGERTELLYKFS